MRQVVYSPEVLRASSARRLPGPIAEGDDETSKPDGYATKLVKYVPAETVAFVSFISLAPLRGALAWAVFAAALIGSIIYIALKGPQPWYGMLLVLVSTFVWVLATTNFGEVLLGLTYSTSRVILGITVFIIPGVDEFVTRLFRRSMAR
jgi:hypothetical protein